MEQQITLEDVKQRAAAAGLVLREDRLEMVRQLLNDALAPLHRLDSRQIPTLEPAATFDAAPGGDHGRR